jgi:hypothetical protein
MKINISLFEANVIQVALDHLYEEHTDIQADAIRSGDSIQMSESYHIQSAIEDLQREIQHHLDGLKED